MSSLIIRVARESEGSTHDMGTLSVDKRAYGGMVALDGGKVQRLEDDNGKAQLMVYSLTQSEDGRVVKYINEPLPLELARGEKFGVSFASNPKEVKTSYTIMAE